MNLSRIRDEIDKRGIKHRWLAKQIGVHPTTLSRFLCGKIGLAEEAQEKLFRILKLKPEDVTKVS
jgi:plasmid maintenance system antidote protein VapI